jgi:hypothetical protein
VRTFVVGLGMGVVMCALLLPRAASAQQATASGIAGVVKDHRNLAACRRAAVCVSTATVPIIVPQTMFDDRLARLDLRVAKRIVISDRSACRATSTSTTCSTAVRARRSTRTNWGPLWLQPSLLQDGRMIQFSASLTF